MGPQCYVCYTLMGLADNKFARPSQSGGGGGGGGGVNVLMFPEIKGHVPLPSPPPSKFCCLLFPIPQFRLKVCSSVSIKSCPYFPRSPEIIPFSLSPKHLGELHQ